MNMEMRNWNEADIDRTHIIVLREESGSLKVDRFPIAMPLSFIAYLKSMVEDSSKTVCDMEAVFTAQYPMTEAKIDYLFPVSYNDSYVDGTQYPEIIGEDRMNSEAQMAIRSAWQNYVRRTGDQSGEMPEDLLLDAKRKVLKQQKEHFLKPALRWIYACCYRKAVKEIKNDPSIKTLSTERIGWNSFKYNINNDIKIQLSTNFGFGKASYFLLSLSYKGIPILPYSYLVNYYHVGIADIIRCTRTYLPDRKSWSPSFEFVSDFVSQAVAQPEMFIRKYIMDEIIKMMDGLEKIMADPKIFMDKIMDKTPEPMIVNLSSMNLRDQKRLAVYPEEMPLLFKVEKVTGALSFLKSMTELSTEVITIRPYIQRIIEFNKNLLPEIAQAISRISGKIQKADEDRTAIEQRIAEINNNLQECEAKIKALSLIVSNDSKLEYDRIQQEKMQLINAKRNLYSDLYKVNNLIRDLKSFVSTLNDAVTKISDSTSICDAA